MSRYDVPYVGTKEPMVEEIWAIVPLSRPEMVPRIVANIERQTIRPKVCVVENGRGLGACEEHGYKPDVLLTSEAHQSHARNEALSYLQTKSPYAYWVSFDDDDYYGPEYVAEHAGLAKRGQVVGKGTHWVHFEGHCLVLFSPWRSSGGGSYLNGATLGAFVKDSPPFQVLDVGEDTVFVSCFLARGGKAWHSSPYHVAYCRREEGHTFRAGLSDFIKNMGLEYLVFPEDRLDLVRGEMPIVGGKLLKWPNLPL